MDTDEDGAVEAGRPWSCLVEANESTAAKAMADREGGMHRSSPRGFDPARNAECRNG